VTDLKVKIWTVGARKVEWRMPLVDGCVDLSQCVPSVALARRLPRTCDLRGRSKLVTQRCDASEDVV
jgi:hypothetical protein